MRFRHLMFLPIATMIGFVVLASAASLVSALERSIQVDRTSIHVAPYESECDRLFREVHALSHEVTSCEARSACVGSPLLCAVAMDSSVDRTFARLRAELNEACGVPLELMDYAWGGPAGEGPGCGGAHDWLEAARSGESEPSSYVF